MDSNEDGDAPEGNDEMQTVDVDVATSPAQTKDAAPNPGEFEEHDQPIVDLDTKYVWQMSTWDASLFIGHKSVGCAGSVAMTLILATTIVIQVGFCFLAIEKLGKSSYGDAVTENMRWWRTDAHLKQYGQDEVSLVDRVCNGDPTLMVGTDVKARVAMIKDYLPEFAETILASGPFMVMLALAIWYALLTKELHNIFSFSLAMVSIPKGSRTILRKTPDGGIELATLGKVRIVMAASALAVRLSIASVLCYAGTLRTAYTTNWGGILLNALKLNLIAAVSEHLFTACMPQNVKEMFKKLKPLPRPGMHAWKGLDAWSSTVLVLIPVGLVVSYYTVIAPELSHQLDAYNALCDGDRTFQHVDHHDVVLWLRGEKFKKRDFKSDLLYVATQEIAALEGAEPSEPLIGLQAPSIGIFDGLMVQGPSELSGILNPSCLDLLGRPRGDFTALQDFRHVDYLRRSTGNQSISRCADVAHHCTTGFAGKLYTLSLIHTRRYCPRTCGCDVPYALYDHNYCGMLNECDSGAKFRGIMEQRECENVGVAELANSSVWQSLARQVKESVTAVPPEQHGAAGAAGLLPWATDSTSRNAVLAAENMSLEATHEFLMLELGCDYVFMAMMLTMSVARLDNPCFSRAILYHCPVACYCHMTIQVGCPNKCSR